MTKLALNSPSDDWSPCLSADGELLIFTSNRVNEHLADDYGRFDNEIYFSTLNRKWTAILKPSITLNTEKKKMMLLVGYPMMDKECLFIRSSMTLQMFLNPNPNGTKWETPERKMGKAGNSVNTTEQ